MQSKGLLIAAILIACTACGETKTVTAQPVIATVTATPRAEPAPTVTVTATKTATVSATATVTEAATPIATGPVDVTAEYMDHAQAVHMSQEQQRSVVQAWLDGGVLNVLTDMRPDWGGWACNWEPDSFAEGSVKFSRILYQDGSLFRICH